MTLIKFFFLIFNFFALNESFSNENFLKPENSFLEEKKTYDLLVPGGYFYDSLSKIILSIKEEKALGKDFFENLEEKLISQINNLDAGNKLFETLDLFYSQLALLKEIDLKNFDYSDKKEKSFLHLKEPYLSSKKFILSFINYSQESYKKVSRVLLEFIKKKNDEENKLKNLEKKLESYVENIREYLNFLKA